MKLLLALVLMASAAHADVDWARGLIIAEGVGIANRQAPSPAAAREPARRMAEDAARKQLAAQLPALPLASGGTVKDRLTSTAVAERIAKVVERAYPIAAAPQTDGSWTVTLALPLEAVRLALHGSPRSQLPEGDLAPPVVIVEGVTAKPALGYAIGHWAAAVIWRKDVPAWAKDAPRVKATGEKPGLIEIPDGNPLGAPRKPGQPSVDAVTGPPPTTNGGPSTLYLVLRP